MKAIRVPMTYSPTGERLWWVVRRESHGWTFDDHDGYSRFGGVNWLELVGRFSLTAENYNMNHNLS